MATTDKPLRKLLKTQTLLQRLKLLCDQQTLDSSLPVAP
jgi:hypothetical protein